MATNTTINKKEYYRITRTIGYKYVDGKRVPVKKQFYGSSKGNAENKYKKFLEAQTVNSYDPLRLTGDIAREFNEEFKYNGKYTESTKDLYIRSYKTHFEAMGIENIPIGQLTYKHIQDAYKGLKCSEDALKTFHKWMRHFVNYCETEGYCSDVLKQVTIPSKEKIKHSDEIITWTDKEVELIKDKMSDHIYYPCIMLALYGGLRLGEILGLKWADIRDGQIHVNRQFQRGTISKPKSKSARVIPLHKHIEDSLKDYPRVSEFIFVTASGQHIDHKNFRRSLDRAYRSIGIEPKKFHAFRATFCTNLCKKGVSLEVASKLMGHKDVTVTAKYYTYVGDEQMADAINKL